MSKSTISSQNNPYQRLIIVLTVGAIIFGCGTIILLVYAMRPEIATLLALTTPTPAMPCGKPVLTIGSTPYEIESHSTGTGSSLNIPEDTPAIAYHVQSTEAGDVFVLSPTRENLISTAAAQAGDPIDITWADCAHESYTSNGVQQMDTGLTDLLDDQVPGITVFVQMDESQTLLIHGDLIAAFEFKETPGQSQETGNQEESQQAEGQQAEIQFAYTSVSEDGETLFMSTSILNSSGDVIVLQEGDFSLTTEDNQTLSPLNIEPVPPIEIQPGQEAGIHLSFPNPEGETAVLHIQSLSENVDLTANQED
ncbi:MAG: hypothetical protein EHM41_13545 [Chloroflexi bacterium]|nr:MAG: hypothetical protein EHM41_13545 [Chloroflexota bacterium]